MLRMKSTNYRMGGANNQIIRFGMGECILGAILVAISERSICAIALGDDPEALARDLLNKFSQAERVGNNHNNFKRLIAEVVGFVEAPSIGLQIPLDVRGTVFSNGSGKRYEQFRSAQPLVIPGLRNASARRQRFVLLLGRVPPTYWLSLFLVIAL